MYSILYAKPLAVIGWQVNVGKTSRGTEAVGIAVNDDSLAQVGVCITWWTDIAGWQDERRTSKGE